MEKVAEGIYRGEITPLSKRLNYPVKGEIVLVRVQSGHDMSAQPKKEPIFMDKHLSEYFDPNQQQCTIVDIPVKQSVEAGEELRFKGLFDDLYRVTIFYSKS
jgi:ABC-type antimicrobial peptide transport system ATPase subunit